MKFIRGVLLFLLCCRSTLDAADTEALKSAIRHGLARVTQAASSWQGNQSCFSCHHQTLPMLAAREAERVGFEVDPAWFRSQADTTHSYFEERTDAMDAGRHVPGGAATVGFGFWALSLDERAADSVTTSMVTYLLRIQGVVRLPDPGTVVKPGGQSRGNNDGHWQASCRRPPMQASLIGDTVLVLIGIDKYASAAQRQQVDDARRLAEEWLRQAPLRTQQDRLWRLWGLQQRGGTKAEKQKVTDAILAAQRDDGGWPETDDRQSDAYSTGQTLFTLLKSDVPPDHPAVTAARDFLLKTQHADGSWLAESHVPFKAQPYFENGDPHGEHQFLSTAATAWSTAALANLLPITEHQASGQRKASPAFPGP